MVIQLMFCNIGGYTVCDFLLVVCVAMLLKFVACFRSL